MRTILLCSVFAAACVGELDGDADVEEGVTEDEIVDTSSVDASRTVPGENGTHCVASPFNCRFRAGSARVTTPTGGVTWSIRSGASVRDGNGHAMFVQGGGPMTFNYGQTRALAGKAHALAVSTSNLSAGWYAIDHIVDEAAFRDAMGEVNAKDPGDGRMACYEVRNSHDASIELKKVVFDSKVGDEGHERAGDYLPLVRANGARSANLVFSVPGFGLGGATTDHFPAGTRFRRVAVPTSSGRPSITIPLWVKDGEGRFRKRSGSLRFLYGFVRAQDGAKRFGWMAQDALKVSTGCP